MKGTIVANPFVQIEVLPVDREALFGGLISAAHPVEYARHAADTLPSNDGSLQMLARHRLSEQGRCARLAEVRLDLCFQRVDGRGINDAKATLAAIRALNTGGTHGVR